MKMLKQQKATTGVISRSGLRLLMNLVLIFGLATQISCVGRLFRGAEDQTRLEEHLRGSVTGFWDSLRWELHERSVQFVDSPEAWEPALERFILSKNDAKITDWTILQVDVKEAEDERMVGNVIVRYQTLSMHDLKVHTQTVSQVWEREGIGWKLTVDSLPLESYFIGFPNY